MSFLDEGTVRATANMIAKVTSQARMPPWYADRRHGEFLGERGLDLTELEILRRWAADGAPRGEPADAPERPEFGDGWLIGEPDLVTRVTDPIEIAATGVIPYAYRVVDPGLEQDAWVSAVEFRPEDSAAAHHILAAAIPPEVSDADALDKANWSQFFAGGYFAIYVPGARPHIYPSGMAKKLEAGTRFLLEFHFTATGEASSDRTRIGLRFAEGEVEHAVKTVGIFNTTFRIPPGVPNYLQTVSSKFGSRVKLLSLFPHLHLRGKSFRFELNRAASATANRGRREILLNVPHYDTYWQDFYRLREPLLLEADDELTLIATFDNSASNRNNPDPTAEVTWGWQEWEEMLAGYVDYIVVDE